MLELPKGRRTVGVILGLWVGLLAGGGLWAFHGYRGLTLAIVQQLRHATLEETWNFYSWMDYWLEWMQELVPDEETGIYDFYPHLGQHDDDLGSAKMAFHRGHFSQAIRRFEGAIGQGGSSEEGLFWLAMSYMRQAESENCLEVSSRGVAQGNVEKPAASSGHRPTCSLPLVSPHPRKESAARAAELFLRLLLEYDEDDRLYQWLMTFNSMTAGVYPDHVPEKYRVRSPFMDAFYGETGDAAAVELEDLVLEEKAAELNVATYDTGRGVAVEDFDGDGDLDLVVGSVFGSLRYYRNENGITFTERSQEAGLGAVTQPFIITAADYDNDGWMDLFVARPFQHFVLLRNDGDGTFTDTTEAAGLLRAKGAQTVAATWVSAWGDVDNDGDLDLFLAQWALRLPFVRGLMARPRMDSVLFINQGLSFEDRSREYGLADELHDLVFVGAAFGDYDNDGYTDLYLSSPLWGISALFRNRDGTSFTKTGGLMDRRAPGFLTAMLDVNHDGRLDLFQAGFADARTSTKLTVFKDRLDVCGHRLGEIRSGHSGLLAQKRDGRFEDGGGFSSLHMPMGTMGGSYGDLNNDGCFDFYLGTGNPEPWFVLPNLMYLGEVQGTRCTGRMRNISMHAGLGTIQKGHGVVFFDFDDDGDQDVYSSLGGMWPGDRWPNQFFVNRSQLNRSWVKIRLRGRRTNRFGVGARLRVEAVDETGRGVVRHHKMDNKTGFGSAPYLAHIGLLNATEIRNIEVYWPASGCTGSYRGVLNSLNVLDERDCERSREQKNGDVTTTT